MRTRRPRSFPRYRAPLGATEIREFLCNYWQKRPLLIRQALPGFRAFLTLNDLQSLARNSSVESRLVIEKGGTAAWQVRHGPLRRADFAKLPDSHWSLLVQGVDLHVPDGAGLLRRFDFIPNWRVDDLMISYAPDGGSVGAHADSYDVFLLQAAGRRRWRIGATGERNHEFIPDLDLRILRRFRAVQEWLLEPGDMLYLPPGIAHHGIAEGECMTYSIGFRASTDQELIAHWLDDGVRKPVPFGDPGRRRQRHPGEISRTDLKRIRALMQSHLPRGPELARWFGRFASTLPEPVRATPQARQLQPPQFKSKLANAARLVRLPASRAMFALQRPGLTLFVNGEAYAVAVRHAAFVRAFCGHGVVRGRMLRGIPARPGLLKLCTALYNAGVLGIEK